MGVPYRFVVDSISVDDRVTSRAIYKRKGIREWVFFTGRVVALYIKEYEDFRVPSHNVILVKVDIDTIHPYIKEGNLIECIEGFTEKLLE
tara:strand:- start:386 stop:655 length:270 start_codon:yes stop_codon:yes gene_type:complete